MDRTELGWKKIQSRLGGIIKLEIVCYIIWFYLFVNLIHMCKLILFCTCLPILNSLFYYSLSASDIATTIFKGLTALNNSQFNYNGHMENGEEGRGLPLDPCSMQLTHPFWSILGTYLLFPPAVWIQFHIWKKASDIETQMKEQFPVTEQKTRNLWEHVITKNKRTK